MYRGIRDFIEFILRQKCEALGEKSQHILSESNKDSPRTSTDCSFKGQYIWYCTVDASVSKHSTTCVWSKLPHSDNMSA